MRTTASLLSTLMCKKKKGHAFGGEPSWRGSVALRGLRSGPATHHWPGDERDIADDRAAGTALRVSKIHSFFSKSGRTQRPLNPALLVADKDWADLAGKVENGFHAGKRARCAEPLRMR